MKQVKGFNGKSQFDVDINARYRTSACGPVTAYVILRYHLLESSLLHINELYHFLGGTKIGLFKWRFIRKLRKLLGASWVIEQCGIEELKQEIAEGRPVAAKFDKWFTFHWFTKYSFDYHWVPVIGYNETAAGLILLVHDNGGRHRESEIREIAYEPNRRILSFIKIAKRADPKDHE